MKQLFSICQQNSRNGVQPVVQ